MNGTRYLFFLTAGGAALQQYDEYKKIEVIDGVYHMLQPPNGNAPPHAHRHHC